MCACKIDIVIWTTKKQLKYSFYPLKYILRCRWLGLSRHYYNEPGRFLAKLVPCETANPPFGLPLTAANRRVNLKLGIAGSLIPPV